MGIGGLGTRLIFKFTSSTNGLNEDMEVKIMRVEMQIMPCLKTK